ncbi:hypothetical protein TEA_003981 [Camellia sinensis var. sinensis]|uniref:leucine--tRNA ligase n=1 Tax=Camellia sinensis var. sinensis TaxID=542762 RepID=A0A4S4E3E2_CAMSN|nr:hypothetical protein TEA_003981 [Camellia sinensis var. sinensis]
MPDGGSSGDSERPYSGESISVNSLSLILGLDINGFPSKEAASKVIEWVEKIGNGNKKVTFSGCLSRKVNYKLRNWLFARQHYWGEPIPFVFLKDTSKGVPLPESELPLALPELDDFTPTGTGEPPLPKAISWVVTADPLSGKPARRETNTMPQWAGSCWYYMRFMDLKNSEALVDKMKEMYWSPVDVYVGGAEHAVLHLLYSRFWHKVLYDIGVLIQTRGLSEGKYSCLVTKDGTVAIDKEPLLEQLRFLHKCIDKLEWPHYLTQGGGPPSGDAQRPKWFTCQRKHKDDTKWGQPWQVVQRVQHRGVFDVPEVGAGESLHEPEKNDVFQQENNTNVVPIDIGPNVQCYRDGVEAEVVTRVRSSDETMIENRADKQNEECDEPDVDYDMDLDVD